MFIERQIKKTVRSLAVALVALLALMVSENSRAATKTITDDDGQVVIVEKPFTRIISLYGAHTENLFYLGLDGEIIGVRSSDDYPPQALEKAKFNYREDAEKFIAARPDLVLIRPMISRAYPHLLEKLRLTGITVVSLQPTSIEETFAYWQKLGILIGREERSAEMVEKFKRETEEIYRRVARIPEEARKRVYFEAIHRKMKTFAPTSMAVYALNVAGGANVAADADQVRNTNIAAYGKERILSHGGEIDVFLAQQGVMNKIDRRTIIEEPGFSVIKAVRKGEVYLIDEKLVSRPTMRLVEGIRRIGAILYPELFQDG